MAHVIMTASDRFHAPLNCDYSQSKYSACDHNQVTKHFDVGAQEGKLETPPIPILTAPGAIYRRKCTLLVDICQDNSKETSQNDVIFSPMRPNALATTQLWDSNGFWIENDRRIFIKRDTRKQHTNHRALTQHSALDPRFRGSPAALHLLCYVWPGYLLCRWPYRLFVIPSYKN
jgi:hypothetical protein